MKKIALLHYAYPPNIAGVEKLLKEHAQILSEIGYDVLVLTGFGKEDNPKIRLIEDKEFQSILSFNPDLQKKIVQEGTMDEDFHKLSESIERKLDDYLSDRDIVIVHNMTTLVHNLPFISAFKKYIARNPEKKIIIWTHDQTFIHEGRVLEEKEGVSLNKEEKRLLMTPIESATYVAISRHFKKLLSEVMTHPLDKITVIPDGINIKQFLEIDDSIWQIIQRNKLFNRFPIILSPVNILQRKNIEYCLDVVAFLKKHYPDVVFIVSGRPSFHRSIGNYFEFIKEKIIDLDLRENTIFIADTIERAMIVSEMHDLYDIADVVFYFSKSENFGLPILESYLSKTPIFISDLEVFHEIGEENMNYIKISETNQEETAQKIKDYLESNQKINMIRHIRNHYNLENIIREKLIPLF